MGKITDFSLWCDFIEREFLAIEFKSMIARGEINGATSNPTIFSNAILTSSAYKSDIEKLRSDGKNAKTIYENLAFIDIKSAAESLLQLWKQNNNNGFISIEIDPNLCDDVAHSIDEGRRIFRTINMPNVMIKVPATSAGYEVMNALYMDKINVNATLIFSQEQVKKCLEAFGGESNANHNNSSNPVPKAVISIFVSRFDRYLEANPVIKVGNSSDSAPKLGIYNAMKCYEIIEAFGNPHIRTLFASTGVKGGMIPSAYYVEKLLLKNSINTAPLATIKDFVALDSPMIEVAPKIDEYLAQFNVQQIADELLEAGLGAFKIEFEKMLKSI